MMNRHARRAAARPGAEIVKVTRPPDGKGDWITRAPSDAPRGARCKTTPDDKVPPGVKARMGDKSQMFFSARWEPQREVWMMGLPAERQDFPW